METNSITRVDGDTDQMIDEFGRHAEEDKRGSEQAGSILSKQLTRCYLLHLWHRYGYKLSLAVVACAVTSCLLNSDCVKFFLLSHARIFLVKAVLPWFDWRRVMTDFCFVRNPIYVPPYTLRLRDCDLCEATAAVPHITGGLHPETFLADFVDKAQPVILSGDPGLADWPVMQLRLDQLQEFYANLADEYMLGEACDLRHNQPSNLRSQEALLAAVLDRGWTNWVASWRHCDLAEIKAFRQFYSRPDFLPLSVSTIGSSYVLAWHSYAGNRTRRVPAPPEPNLLLLIQVNGTARIHLTPKFPCDEVCPELRLALSPGQILAVSNRFYATDWAPGSKGSGFTFGFEGDTESF